MDCGFFVMPICLQDTLLLELLYQEHCFLLSHLPETLSHQMGLPLILMYMLRNMFMLQMLLKPSKQHCAIPKTFLLHQRLTVFSKTYMPGVEPSSLFKTCSRSVNKTNYVLDQTLACLNSHANFLA